MQKPSRQDVRPNKSVLKKLKRVAKLSRGQKAFIDDIIKAPTNTGPVNPKPYYYRQYINGLTPHELVYITNILSTQLDCHVQPTYIDRNRIVEFDAVTMVFGKSMYIEKNTIRITIKKIKKAFANKDQYIEIKSICTTK